MMDRLATSSTTISHRVALAVILGLAMCAATVLHARMPRAEKHESRREINHIEEAWRMAVLKADMVAMNSLLADDFMAITPDGTLLTREQTLARLHDVAAHFTLIQDYDRKLRFYRTTALVTSRAQVSGSYAGGDISGDYLCTRVYVRDAHDAWKIVSFETRLLPNPYLQPR
jgi:ketosteroid isomerase-like protein